MYVPRHFALEDLEEIRSLVRDVHVGQLVTVGADGTPDASLLPVPGRATRSSCIWPGRTSTGAASSTVPRSGRRDRTDAYITPRWYASKREHGRVVPTWNYSAVHLTGPVTVHDDPSGCARR